MGIFSFGKKEDDAPPRRGSRSGARAVRTERVERRPRRTERPDTDALLLDPTLPEKHARAGASSARSRSSSPR